LARELATALPAEAPTVPLRESSEAATTIVEPRRARRARTAASAAVALVAIGGAAAVAASRDEPSPPPQPPPRGTTPAQQARHRGIDDLERRDVLERDRQPRPALVGAQLVENAVLRHLEQPGRELAPEREPREPLEDAEEDLLGQILGEAAVADDPEDVVEDG